MANHDNTHKESQLMTSTSQKSVSQTRLYAYCAFLVLAWASAFTLVGVAVPHISPIWLVTHRLVIGSIILAAYVKFIGQKFPPLTDIRWLWYTVLGFTGMLLPLTLAAKGQLSIDSGLTAIIVGAMPLITIVLAHFFTEERLTWPKLIGFGIGFCGIILLFLPDDFSLSLIADWKAQLLVLSAALSYGVTTVAAKRAPPTPPILGGTMMLIGVTPLALITALATGVPSVSVLSDISLIAIAAVITLAVFSTALTNIVYLRVIAISGPSIIAKINYFVPPLSVILGMTLLSEPFTWRMFIAFAVILIGMMITRTGDKKRAKKAASALKP